MGREFEIRREVTLPASAQDVFEAVTTGTDAWLFPTGSAQAEVGATTEDGSTVLAWDRPHHFAVRADGPDGWFNALEFLIEGRDGGSAVLRYVHSGIFTDDWDTQYDGASAHTDFYLHTLGQYVEHFTGRRAVYAGGGPGGIMAPPPSAEQGSFEVLRRSLGIAASTAVGDSVSVDLLGAGEQAAVVTYVTDHFVGLRTDDALYCLFGRDAWGMPVAISAHLFAEGADPAVADKALEQWLAGVYA